LEALDDFATASFVVINGLKGEDLVASNSMILHELYFDGLGSEGKADRNCAVY
jgi:Fe-Mn family superoxide dismutase